MEALIDIIHSYDHSEVGMAVKKGIFVVTYKKKRFEMRLTVTDGKMLLAPVGDKFENIHLVNVVNAKKINNINAIFDLLDTITIELSNITNYCSTCYKKLDFQSDRYVTCGATDCMYDFEKLVVGSYVLDRVKEDQEIVQFLIDSAVDAMTCARKWQIFEPFPTHFLKDSGSGDGDVKIERGQLSKLTGKNLDKYKDFDKLEACGVQIDFKRLLEAVKMSNDDEGLSRRIGLDIYKLIRFIIMSCKTDVVKDSGMDFVKQEKGVSLYKIIHGVDKEEAFKDKKTYFLFHGSKWCNWYSIMRNGLKNCSQTALMTTGAAYGNGIYLSDNISVSLSYGTSGSKSVIGVFEVIGDKATYKKAEGYYVIDNEKVLIQRYLIILNGSVGAKQNFVGELNNMFNSRIHEEKVRVTTMVLNKGIKKIVKEYKNIMKENPEKAGFRIEVDTKNLYLWRIFIFGYDEKELIGKDMKKFGVKEIEMEVNFPGNYPLSPPFIRVVKPRFERQTGHITSGGSLCLEVLTEKYWSPACSIESLIVTIKSEVLEGGGRLDPKMYHIPYSDQEAREAFVRVARGHGWM